MPFRRQIGRVAVPVEQVERHIVRAEQIIVGDVIPDQVAPAQQVERRGQIAPVQEPLRRQRANHRQLVVGHEILQFARRGEIALRGEEGGACHRVRLPTRGEQRQRRRQRRARDAITDRMHRRHVEQRPDRVDRINLSGDVIVPDHVLHRRIRRLPGHHENGDALLHRPADEAFLGRQIEDVIAVDPGRKDHQRRRQHVRCRRRVLDQLVQGGALHHLARRHRQVAPHLERAVTGVGQLPLADVGEHVFHAVEQVLALGLDRLGDHFRIGQREVRRAHRVDQPTRGEAQLLALLVGHTLQRLDPAQQMIVRPIILHLLRQPALALGRYGGARPGGARREHADALFHHHLLRAAHHPGPMLQIGKVRRRSGAISAARRVGRIGLGIGHGILFLSR
ncbi:hypothetical protein WR25_24996 [Diploscapter pachys]|uniref:Uncharacterized protein n=1 Tax=Diploscapter pachys TaxID=2018661 RepID=A0A2A2JZJ6_9BILA|nr:hypothetical protein WR25_24996 [Diploscapter pachys]